MHIAGIAINTAMFAALVGIHAVPHAHIWTFYFVYNGFSARRQCIALEYLVLSNRQYLQYAPWLSRS